MGLFQGFRAVFSREWKQILREKRIRLLTLILPLASFVIFIAVFWNGVVRDVPVGVLNLDGSSLASEMIRSLDSSPSLEMISVPSLEDGKRMMRRGSLFGLVVLDRDLEKNCFGGQSPAVPFYYNNNYMSVSSVILRDVTTVISASSAKILGSKLLASGIPASGIEGYLIPVAVEAHILFNPFMSYMYYLAPSLLFTMLHFFILLCSLYSLGSELKNGTAGDTYRLSGSRIFVMLTGKLLPYTLIFHMLAFLVFFLLFGWLKMNFAGSYWLMAAGTSLMILGYQAMGVVFLSVSGRFLMGLFSASFYASTAYTFIGMTFPHMAMYLPAKIWAHVLPLYHFTNIYLGVAMKGAGFEDLYSSFIWAAGFLILPLLMMNRLKKFYLNKEYYGDWGRLGR